MVLNSVPSTIFLSAVGLVDPDKLKLGDLGGVSKDNFLILDTVPSEYDSRAKAMEVDEKPTEDYNDIGRYVAFTVLGNILAFEVRTDETFHGGYVNGADSLNQAIAVVLSPA
ncbi:hypothetical protein EJ110_NYTH38567 [Nymphaea thermarum]|nr:hypothetical protein EJ110_NYTH38567 [Nymphaea thermarum]